MHNRYWLSLLLALFLTASGCAKHEDTGSAADTKAPAEKRAETTSSERTDTLEKKPTLQDKPAEDKSAQDKKTSQQNIPEAPAAAKPAVAPAQPASADELLESDSPSPKKTKDRGQLQTNESKADRKKETGAAEQQAAPSGDDMERMD